MRLVNWAIFYKPPNKSRNKSSCRLCGRHQRSPPPTVEGRPGEGHAEVARLGQEARRPPPTAQHHAPLTGHRRGGIAAVPDLEAVLGERWAARAARLEPEPEEGLFVCFIA